MVRIKPRGERHNKTWRTEPALRTMLADHGRLDRMKPFLSQCIHRQYLMTDNITERRNAGVNGLVGRVLVAANKARAGAAIP